MTLGPVDILVNNAGTMYLRMFNLTILGWRVVRHTEVTLGPVDILVNNAGTMYYRMFNLTILG